MKYQEGESASGQGRKVKLITHKNRHVKKYLAGGSFVNSL